MKMVQTGLKYIGKDEQCTEKSQLSMQKYTSLVERGEAEPYQKGKPGGSGEETDGSTLGTSVECPQP